MKFKTLFLFLLLGTFASAEFTNYKQTGSGSGQEQTHVRPPSDGPEFDINKNKNKDGKKTWTFTKGQVIGFNKRLTDAGF